jgi:hypothetical protein
VTPSTPGDARAAAARGCPHPWLRVTCGACGAPVDALALAGPGAPAGAEPGGAAPGGPDGRALFIVARGRPELVEQLRAVMGQGEIAIIEDRRQGSRAATVSDEAAASPRAALRRRLAGDGPPELP